MLLLVGGLAFGYFLLVFGSARRRWAELHERQGCHTQPVDEVRHEDMPPMGGLTVLPTDVPDDFDITEHVGGLPAPEPDRDVEAAALALLADWDCRVRLAYQEVAALDWRTGSNPDRGCRVILAYEDPWPAMDGLREALAALADRREVARQLDEPWDDPARTAQRAGR